jgi:hypothetical protein
MWFIEILEIPIMHVLLLDMLLLIDNHSCPL